MERDASNDGRNLGREEFDHHFPRTIYDDGAGSRPAIVEGFSIKVASGVRSCWNEIA
jgi:hypothetical protein